MSGNKTVETDGDVDAFLDGVEDETRRRDCRQVLAMMKRVTGKEPKMWGDSIVGFDRYHYKYDSGREGDFFITGFSPRKAALTIYIMPGYGMVEKKDMKALGKVRTGKSCLYVNRLADIDVDLLETIVAKSVAWMRAKYPQR